MHLIAGFNCYSIDHSLTAESKISKMSTASVLRSKLVVVGDWAVSKIIIISTAGALVVVRGAFKNVLADFAR